jgi:hypothetical protein
MARHVTASTRVVDAVGRRVIAEQAALSVRLAYHLFPQVPGQELDDLRR